jgi:hypothetical protein
MVRIYLQQELLTSHHAVISIEDGQIMIDLTGDGLPLSYNLDTISNEVKQLVQNIRNRNYDLSFTIRTANLQKTIYIPK